MTGLFWLCVGIIIGIVASAWPRTKPPEAQKEPVAYDAKGRPIYEEPKHKLDIYA